MVVATMGGVRISRATGGRKSEETDRATMNRRRIGQAAGILDRAAGGLVCGSSASRTGGSRPWMWISRTVEVHVPDHGEDLAQLDANDA